MRPGLSHTSSTTKTHRSKASRLYGHLDFSNCLSFWLPNDFSFSGVKTALLRLVEGKRVLLSANQGSGLSVWDAAASFQEAVIDVLVTKTVAAAKEHRVKQVLLAGGVASNSLLRHRLAENSPIPVMVPEPVLCTDNATMVAACGYFRFQLGKVNGLDLDVVPSLKMT